MPTTVHCFGRYEGIAAELVDALGDEGAEGGEGRVGDVGAEEEGFLRMPRGGGGCAADE